MPQEPNLLQEPPQPTLRVVLLLEYDGDSFCGNQIQPEEETVQLALQRAFSALEIPLLGPIHFAGRTDAGVHALGQVAQCDVDFDAFSRLANPIEALHAHLPVTVSIRQLHKLPSDVLAAEAVNLVGKPFHATASARWRWYRYVIDNQPMRSSFTPKNAHWFKHPLDMDVLNASAACIIGAHDFTSFQAANPSNPHANCMVLHAGWTRDASGLMPDRLYFDIIANRFVYRMVRQLVGTMLQVATRGGAPETLKTLLETPGSESLFKKTAPANGLTLMAVYYPAPWDFFCEDVYVKTLEQQVFLYQKNLNTLKDVIQS